MDPQQTAVYAKAHDELRDLFREIAHHGRVTAHELQHALLPFTAGDAKRDLQELVDDMKRKQTSLDEPDFIRIMWKKMYLSNLVYTTQQTAAKARPASAGGTGRRSAANSDQAINIPLAHVIVSIKRRAQLKQFANYYASRGISGADHLSTGSDGTAAERSTPRHLLHAQRKRQAATAAVAQAASITALRDRKSASYDLIAYSYDTETLCMKAHRMFSKVEMATVANCSRLHCMVSNKELGVLIVGSRHFMDHTRACASRLLVDDQQPDQTFLKPSYSERADHDVRIKSSQIPIAASVAKDLYLTKLDELGLRNVIAFGVGRGTVVVTTERRVHCWKAFGSQATATVETPSAPNEAKAFQWSIPLKVIEFLEDEGDCFGHVSLLKRAKTVGDVAGIRHVACGDQFVIGVTEGSELFAWGEAPLGRGKAVPTRLPFVTPLETMTVSRVVCGLHHVLLLASNGSVFAWGANVYGQLGLTPRGSALDATVHEPTDVKLPSLALDIACGDHHSVVLTDKGSLFAWGNNWHGQLGLDPDASETGCVFAPTKVHWWISWERDHAEHHDESRPDLDGDESPSPRRRPRASVSRSDSSSPVKHAAPPSPRAYLLTAIGDTTAIVSEYGEVFVWGKCVPSGPLAGACGLVAAWRPQRVEISEELLDNKRQSVDGTAATISTSPSIASPWAGIAIASGLVLLTGHTTSLPSPSHTSQISAVPK